MAIYNRILVQNKGTDDKLINHMGKLSLRQQIFSGLVKTMAEVSGYFKQFVHHILPIPLHGSYHWGHGAAVNPELDSVHVQALIHKAGQGGVCLEEGGVVLLKLQPSL